MVLRHGSTALRSGKARMPYMNAVSHSSSTVLPFVGLIAEVVDAYIASS